MRMAEQHVAICRAMAYNQHMNCTPPVESVPFDVAVARVHMGGVTQLDWESLTVAGVHGTYRFRLADDCPYVNEAVYAYEAKLAVYVYAEAGHVVELRVRNPWKEDQ